MAQGMNFHSLPKEVQAMYDISNVLSINNGTASFGETYTLSLRNGWKETLRWDYVKLCWVIHSRRAKK